MRRQFSLSGGVVLAWFVVMAVTALVDRRRIVAAR